MQEKVRFLSAAVGPQGIARAAVRGWHLIAERQPAYVAALLRACPDPAAHQAVPLQMVHAAPSHQQAVEEAVEGLHHFANFSIRRRGRADRAEIRSGDMRFFGTPAVGTPDEVTEILLAARDRAPGTTGFAMCLRHDGMRTPEVRCSMRLFAAEVAPHLTLGDPPCTSPFSAPSDTRVHT